jgi:BON domain
MLAIAGHGCPDGGSGPAILMEPGPQVPVPTGGPQARGFQTGQMHPATTKMEERMADHRQRRGEERGYGRDQGRDRGESLGQYGGLGRHEADYDDRYGDNPPRVRSGYGEHMEGYPSDSGDFGRTPDERSGGGYGRNPLGDVITSGIGRDEDVDEDRGYDPADRRRYGHEDRPRGGARGGDPTRAFADRRAARRYDRDYGVNQGSFGYGDEGDRADYGSPGGFGGYGHSLPTGAHRGRGPRGYKRSDARIEEDVNDRLTDDDSVDASDIEVSVSDSEVTLGGTVSDRGMKRRAEDIAESVSGVTHVQNNLRVKQGGA